MDDLREITENEFKNLYLPPPDSHKGQNGRLLVIGGSHLFHAASIWALEVASRIVDLVHYCSVDENNQLIAKLKSEFRNGIIVERKDVESYIAEDDCILIGPGMPRPDVNQPLPQIENLEDVLQINDEGLQTAALTNYLLRKYPHQKWVIDAGALQTVNPSVIPANAVLTPHVREFTGLYARLNIINPDRMQSIMPDVKLTREMAETLNCIVLLKGQTDIVCHSGECRIITGGNAGMTKGGTGDVLAGLIAALACKNDPYLATLAGSYINKKAGDELYARVGPYFNATDLKDQIPVTLKNIYFKT